MGIGQTNDWPGIAGIGEYLLIAGEAGIENDFAAAARDGAARAAIKDAPILERQNGRAMLSIRQCVLQTASFIVSLGS